LLKSRLRLEWGLITVLATLLAVAALYAGVTRRVDNLLYDMVAVWRAPPPSDRILIVEIDNQSLNEVGKWPWPRDVHARLIEELNKAEPKTIAYDVLFMEPGVPEQDAALTAAMAARRNVFLPVLYSTPGLNGASHDILYPVPSLSRAAAGIGTVNLLFDDDGLVRRAQLETRTNGGNLVHLMEQTYRAVVGNPSPALSDLTKPSNPASTAADDDSDSVLIPFQPAGSFRRVSFASVLRGEVPAAFLKGKIALVGSTADGSGDRHPVAASVGSTMSGVEIQANLLNGLLSNRFILAAPFWVALTATVLPIWLLMLVFLRWRPTMNLLISIGFILAILAMAPLSVLLTGFWIPPGPALLGLLFVYPLWGWRRLEALSSFVFHEAQSLKAEPGLGVIGTTQGGGLDSVVRRFMSDVVSGFPDAICVVDSDMRVTLANSAAHDVLGSEIEGRPIAQLLDHVAPGTTASADEMSLADGRTFLIRKVPLTNQAGEEAGFIIRLADISRLREADRERAEVLEFLSHDMRAPQAAIIALLETHKANDGENTLWTRVGENARKTLKLVDDFVQTARISSAQLKMEEVNIASAVAEAIDLVWPQAKRKGIHITAEGLELEAFILGDHSALVRAFTNLIDNAVKYSPHETKVQCHVALEGDDNVSCEISDSGPGLPPARQGNLFARFGARSEQGPSGTGLGLAYVKKVVDRHGGTIDWSSDSGHGTRFKLRFPLLESDTLDT
jgi:CHASE2 domain-containing sensor protein/signal transduction histidine kinase